MWPTNTGCRKRSGCGSCWRQRASRWRMRRRRWTRGGRTITGNGRTVRWETCRRRSSPSGANLRPRLRLGLRFTPPPRSTGHEKVSHRVDQKWGQVHYPEDSHFEWTSFRGAGQPDEHLSRVLIKPTVLSLSARGLFLENGRHETRDMAAIRAEGDRNWNTYPVCWEGPNPAKPDGSSCSGPVCSILPTRMGFSSHAERHRQLRPCEDVLEAILT